MSPEKSQMVVVRSGVFLFFERVTQKAASAFWSVFSEKDASLENCFFRIHLFDIKNDALHVVHVAVSVGKLQKKSLLH